MREALYALAHIEDSLVPEAKRSHIREAMEEEMIANPGNWEKYYAGNDDDRRFARTYSYSDRIRYYWNSERAEKALTALLENLESRVIPMPLVSQYLPEQYWAIRRGEIKGTARSLIHHRVMQVTEDYAKAC